MKEHTHIKDRKRKVAIYKKRHPHTKSTLVRATEVAFLYFMSSTLLETSCSFNIVFLYSTVVL